MKKYLYFVLWIVVMSSCSQNDPLAYENNPAINFKDKDLNFSFFYSKLNSNQENVEITLYVMGKPADVDRPFKLVQSNLGEENAAVPGTHYLPFDSPEMISRMVIPAGKSELKLPITLLKDPSLELSTVKLSIRVMENENFKSGVMEMDSTNVYISSLALKPSNWNDWRYAFGTSWGSVKMRFIIDHTGIADFTAVPTDYYYLLYLNSKLNQALYDYNEAHPNAHLVEADGTFVNF